jgi:hypothetical protein
MAVMLLNSLFHAKFQGLTLSGSYTIPASEVCSHHVHVIDDRILKSTKVEWHIVFMQFHEIL